MKIPALIFLTLAVVAAAFGFWLLAGILAWVIRAAALVFLVLAVLSFRKKAVSGD